MVGVAIVFISYFVASFSVIEAIGVAEDARWFGSSDSADDR